MIQISSVMVFSNACLPNLDTSSSRGSRLGSCRYKSIHLCSTGGFRLSKASQLPKAEVLTLPIGAISHAIQAAVLGIIGATKNAKRWGREWRMSWLTFLFSFLWRLHLMLSDSMSPFPVIDITKERNEVPSITSTSSYLSTRSLDLLWTWT